VHVSLSASDNNQAGIATTYYQVDGGAAQTYFNSFVIGTQGVHQVNYWTVDKLGNTEGQKSQTVKIDWAGSTVQNFVTGTAGGNNFFKSSVQISLSSSDSLSGVAATYYRIDDGPTQNYAVPFTVAGDGIHPVDFWSTDVAGNSDTSYRVMIRIDATGPVTQVNLSGPAGSNGWYRGPVQVLMTAADNFNGVQGIYYTIDNGLTNVYTAPFNMSTVGTHNITYWSVDTILNTETARVVPIRIDTSAPTVTVSAAPANAPKSSTPLTVTVTGRVTDTTSGVLPGGATYQVVDEYGIAQPSGTLVLQANGNYSFTLSLPATKSPGDKSHLYTILVQAVDQAGNTNSASDTVKIN
jgi:large repetitive protein